MKRAFYVNETFPAMSSDKMNEQQQHRSGIVHNNNHHNNFHKDTTYSRDMHKVNLCNSFATLSRSRRRCHLTCSLHNSSTHGINLEAFNSCSLAQHTEIFTAAVVIIIIIAARWKKNVKICNIHAVFLYLSLSHSLILFICARDIHILLFSTNEKKNFMGRKKSVWCVHLICHVVVYTFLHLSYDSIMHYMGSFLSLSLSFVNCLHLFMR